MHALSFVVHVHVHVHVLVYTNREECSHCDMAQSQRRLPAAEASRKAFAPWLASASCVLSNETTSEVLSYAVLRRACTTMAALSSFQNSRSTWSLDVFLHVSAATGKERMVAACRYQEEDAVYDWKRCSCRRSMCPPSLAEEAWSLVL
jgi:hypothetical protein